MINNNHIIEFSTLTGCVTSKHIMGRYGLKDNRQVNRILGRLTDSGYLQKSGSIRREGPGKPVPIYTPTRAGFSKAGIKPRETSSLTGLTRSILLSELVARTPSIDFFVSIEDKNRIFESRGISYPHKDKWYSGNLVFEYKEKTNIIVPFSDYQAAVRMCKEQEKREPNSIYHIVVSADIFDKVNSLTKGIINPFDVYGVKRNLSAWSEIGRSLVNSNIGSYAHIIDEVKKVINDLNGEPSKEVILPRKLGISSYDIGTIFSE
ncbi:hypothetical protein [Agarilytica rhodophyticola]|uniref:hypothetical protein n=1 Tax=Agarilytica rhodophyticola TaxID=1737490 RepID=UPI000CD7E98A|nr:hypothetical protein [Agarilytica rhodophyticola]